MSSLTPARQCLVTVMQRLRYGKILDLVVRDGEPVLDPPPEVVQEVRFSASRTRPEHPRSEDFSLKSPVIDLFRRLTKLGNGTIDILEVQNGLPFRMSVRSTIMLRPGKGSVEGGRHDG